ncbi:MAG: AAA family ATPase [Pyrinomonadaceae bacterium]
MVQSTPFSISPNPGSLYQTEKIKGVMSKVKFVIDQRQGLTVILGDAGLGKTTIARALYAEFSGRPDVAITFVPTPVYTSDFAMLRSLCEDFGGSPRRSFTLQMEEFQSILHDNFKEDKNVVVIIDEAQRLNYKMLEAIRACLNFETDKQKLVQFVLAGQLELRDMLRSYRNKALFSRVTAPSLLDALTPEDSTAMIGYRCKTAGIDNPFDKAAMNRIYELTNGVARDALKLCALAYELMKMSGDKAIDVDLIDSAWDESQIDDPE